MLMTGTLSLSSDALDARGTLPARVRLGGAVSPNARPVAHLPGETGRALSSFNGCRRATHSFNLCNSQLKPKAKNKAAVTLRFLPPPDVAGQVSL